MRTSSRIILLTFVSMLISSVGPVAGQGSAPCEQDPRYSALDFWVGEWQVVDADGQAIGTNRIRKVQNGCLIEESWTSASGGTGQSMNYFDPADGVWKQHWVDQRGGVVHYQGGLDGAAVRVQTLGLRQQGRVLIDHFAVEGVDRAGAENAHVAGEQDEIRVEFGQPLFDGGVLPRIAGRGGIDDPGRDPVVPGQCQARCLSAVGDDLDDPGVELALGDRIQRHGEVGARAGNQRGDAQRFTHR